jgi:hypothetical protein
MQGRAARKDPDVLPLASSGLRARPLLDVPLCQANQTRKVIPSFYTLDVLSGPDAPSCAASPSKPPSGLWSRWKQSQGVR